MAKKDVSCTSVVLMNNRKNKDPKTAVNLKSRSIITQIFGGLSYFNSKLLLEIRNQPYCSDLTELLGSSSKSLRTMQDSGPRLLNCRLGTTKTGTQDTHNVDNACQTCTGRIQLNKMQIHSI